MMGSLYIHIPFCLSKCFYCSFSSFAGQKEIYKPYIRALKKELTTLACDNPSFILKTLFIGGGTPTIFSATLLSGLISHCMELFDKQEEVEVSIEANPGTVNLEYLRYIRAIGCNRISFGVQSFNNVELQDIGRMHDARQAADVVEMSKQAGFKNISLDLMYGLPGQSADSWQCSLQKAIELKPAHLSLYQLTVEPGTILHKLKGENKRILPGEDEVLMMDTVTDRLCREGGLHQYEISNYAVAGYNCLHNMNYWFNDEYLGAGAAAVSYIAGVRERRVSEPNLYIRRINNNNSTVIEKEILLPKASFRETVIMGLRLLEGVSRQRLFDRYGIDVEEYYGHILSKLVFDGLLEVSANNIKITDRGRPFANIVMAELV